MRKPNVAHSGEHYVRKSTICRISETAWADGGGNRNSRAAADAILRCPYSCDIKDLEAADVGYAVVVDARAQFVGHWPFPPLTASARAEVVADLSLVDGLWDGRNIFP